jgi:hypothetical protein
MRRLVCGLIPSIWPVGKFPLADRPPAAGKLMRRLLNVNVLLRQRLAKGSSRKTGSILRATGSPREDDSGDENGRAGQAGIALEP